MDINNNLLYVDANQIVSEWDVSRTTAYAIIKNLNARIKELHPNALIIPGKVNKLWYDSVCLKTLDLNNIPMTTGDDLNLKRGL